MVSKARLFGDDTSLSVILGSEDPREQKRVERQVRHLSSHDDRTNAKLLSFETTRNLSAIENTGARRIPGGNPHDKAWGAGLTASESRAAYPTSCCGFNLQGQAVGCTRKMLHHNTFGNNQPDTSASRDTHSDEMVFEVDQITPVRLDRSLPTWPSSRCLPIRCPTTVPLTPEQGQTWIAAS